MIAFKMIIFIRRRLCIYFILVFLCYLLISQFLHVFNQDRLSNTILQLTTLPYQFNKESNDIYINRNSTVIPYATCPIPKTHRSRSQAPIALATFPGSGTTWLRYLIEESTGYLTATIYSRDNENFKGSTFKDGRAIAIKTHLIYNEFKTPHPFMLDYGKAIILIRHPRNSIIAEVNREFSDNPLGFMDLSWNDSKTLTYQAHMAERWPKFIKSWLNDFARPKLVLVYENLNTNKDQILHSIAEFLNVPILDQGLACLQKYPNGYALRNKQVSRPKYLHPSIEHLLREGLKTSSPILMNYGIYYNLDDSTII